MGFGKGRSGGGKGKGGRGAGGGICWAFQRGECTFDNCRFVHDANAPPPPDRGKGGKGSKGGKGKGGKGKDVKRGGRDASARHTDEEVDRRQDLVVIPIYWKKDEAAKNRRVAQAPLQPQLAALLAESANTPFFPAGVAPRAAATGVPTE